MTLYGIDKKFAARLATEVKGDTAGVVGNRILHNCIGEFAVRYGELFVVEGIGLRDSQVDIPDDPAVAVSLDVVTDDERFILENEDGSDEVFEDVAGRERNPQRERAGDRRKR